MLGGFPAKQREKGSLSMLTRRKAGEKEAYFANCTASYLGCSCSWGEGEQCVG